MKHPGLNSNKKILTDDYENCFCLNLTNHQIAQSTRLMPGGFR
ncbi:MAG: hypothetical protein PHU68_10540 [Paludibacter sp.]|nr:hypothetical protein [Paludibacter sp.]